MLSSGYHWATEGQHGDDFVGLYSAAKRINQAKPLYGAVPIWPEHGFPYAPDGPIYVFPPTVAELLRPLALLPLGVAIRLWGLINGIVLLLSAALVARSAGQGSVLAFSLMAIIGFRYWPATVEFSAGNTNLLLLLTVSAMIYTCNSPGRRKLLPWLIAAGACIKTWFIGFTLYLICQRRWKDALITGGAFGAFMLLLFSAAGLKEWTGFVNLTTTFLNHNVGNYQPAESILGFARLHFAHNRYVDPLISSPWVYWSFVLSLATLVIFGLAKYCSPSNHTSDERTKLSFAVISLLLLLPICDVNYMLLCLPALWLILVADIRTKTKSAKVVYATTFILYMVATRLAYSTTLKPEQMSHGIRSLLISDWFLWMTAMWTVLVWRMEQARQSPAKNL